MDRASQAERWINFFLYFPLFDQAHRKVHIGGIVKKLYVIFILMIVGTLSEIKNLNLIKLKGIHIFQKLVQFMKQF